MPRIIENRDYAARCIHSVKWLTKMSSIYAAEGLQWGLNDRALLLEALVLGTLHRVELTTVKSVQVD